MLRGILQFLFRVLVKIARLILRIFPVRSLSGGKRVYELAYRLSAPRRGADVEVGRHGLTLVGPASDKFMMPGLFGGYYEEREVEAFTRLAAASKVIVDVGANIGLYACLGATRLPADGTLVAFEPVPENLDYLRRNLTGNGLAHKVRVEAAAAGKTPGELAIHIIPDNIGFASASTKRAEDLGSTNSVSVPVVTLDSYLDERGGDPPDIIKTDTEGYDGYVLQGASATIEKARPTLFVEYLPRWLSECDFDPAELLDQIFDHYPHVFAIDEYCGRLSRCTKADLAGFGVEGNFHCANLIATDRADHLAIIESLQPADHICSRVLTS